MKSNTNLTTQPGVNQGVNQGAPKGTYWIRPSMYVVMVYMYIGYSCWES